MNLPTVVCGPALRYCSATDAYIWFCTTRSVIFYGCAYSAVGMTAQPSQHSEYGLVASGTTEFEFQVGKNLFVQLLRLRPLGANASLPLGVPIYYNVTLSDTPLPGDRLPHLPRWQLEAEVPLEDISIRAGDSLPSFLLAGAIDEDIRAIFSSCRKPHGLQRDAIDEVDVFESTKTRPHINVMLGDQIYADDVATQLLREVRQLAGQLIGKDGVSKELLEDLVLGSGESRKPLLLKSGFSSTDSQNHLITYGEFVCMYIYAFCTTQFRKYFSFRVPTIRSRSDTPLLDEFEALISGVSSYNKLSRILANCPTYMIFDDHEVTDDWNVDSSWISTSKTQLRDSVVVRNALYSYFLFQGWGNCPQNPQWNPSTLKEIQFEFCTYLKAIEETGDALLPSRVFDWDWHYELPCARQICVIDTRMRRQYVGVAEIYRLAKPDARSPLDAGSSEPWLRYSSYSDVALISDGNFKPARVAPQIERIRSNYLVLVSASPVFGNSVLQSGQTFDLNPYSPLDDLSNDDKIIKKARTFVADRDFEDWCTHPLSLFRLFDLLDQQGVRSLVVVSGDIHAGYICQGIAEYKGKRINFLQLVTSAARNRWNVSMRSLAAVGQLLGMVPRAPEDYCIWNGRDNNRLAKASYTTANGQMIKPTEAKIGRPPDLRISISRMQEPNGLLMTNNLGYLTLSANGVVGSILSKGGVSRRQAWES